MTNQFPSLERVRTPAAPIPPIPAACPICDGAVYFSPALTLDTSDLGRVCAESAKEETPGTPAYISGKRRFIQWQWIGLKAWATHKRQEAAHATGATA